MTAGVISGAVLRAARKTARLTQEQLAEGLGADIATVKGWESGRRPLSRVQAGRLGQIRRRLREHGARPALLGLLEPAVDADDFTERATEGDVGTLATEVITRPWTGLVSWAARGDVPAAAAGVAGTRPLLAGSARAAFFGTVRTAAERAPAAEDGMLLRRQAYFLAAWDDSADGRAWLDSASRAEEARLRLDGKWKPGWAVARSLAVAQSYRGDLDPLRRFIARELADEDCDTANLAYWAYWTGADPEPASSDDFMAERGLDPERAGTLLRHLTAGLAGSVPYAELSVHAIASITRRHPALLACDSQLAAALREQAERMLDGRDLTAAARRSLSEIHQATKRGTAQ